MSKNKLGLEILHGIFFMLTPFVMAAYWAEIVANTNIDNFANLDRVKKNTLRRTTNYKITYLSVYIISILPMYLVFVIIFIPDFFGSIFDFI